MARVIRKKKLFPAIAIIGEGITERYYFLGMKQNEKLNFKIKPDLPTHPDLKNIIKKAEKLLQQEYDAVYCLIDLDRIISNLKEKDKYQNIRKKSTSSILFFESMPCFEIWFLLHFRYSTRCFNNYSELEPELKKYLTNYEKSENYFKNNNLYLYLKDKLQNAVINAVKLEKERNKLKHSSNFPKCDIYKIINKLINGK